MNDILTKLGIKEVNFGCGIGGSESFATGNGGTLESFNPTTGEKLAEIQMCSEADYETAIEESQKAFKTWQMVPAPIRGQLILEMAKNLMLELELIIGTKSSTEYLLFGGFVLLVGKSKNISFDLCIANIFINSSILSTHARLILNIASLGIGKS